MGGRSWKYRYLGSPRTPSGENIHISSLFSLLSGRISIRFNGTITVVQLENRVVRAVESNKVC